ncbi:hypothetical protein FJTKL_01489 [Diaporthe vaccinii]|uniref:t-SNARE coiled-coil homology domain-containing protein n=1 Tax=Diaporthe vaccinii TaxID=105482 RepID=A0ABR4E0I5_9PEZI
MGLFSKKKKEPVEENPYANPITPYQQARNDVHQQRVGGPGGPGAPGGLPSNPRMNSFASSTAPPPYQSPSVASDNSRFGDEKYGNQNGYGKNRYDNDNASAFSANQSRSGGYGGFGDDAGTNELFGGASSRYVPPQQGGSPSVQSPPNGSSSFQSPPSRYDNDPSKGTLLGNAQDRYNPLPPTARQEGAAEDDEYGGYGAPRELTEEEKDEQAVQGIKDETKALRRAGADTTGRIKNLTYGIREQAAASAARMGEQGDRLRRADQNLNTAAAQSRLAEENTKELIRVDGSMFSGFRVTTKNAREKADQAKLEQYRQDKKAAQDNRSQTYQANQRMEDTFSATSKPKPRLLGADRQARKKDFSFENDSEDEELEDTIDRDLDDVHDALGDIKTYALGLNREISDQNELLGRMNEKSDAVDDHVRMNREKLNRFR